VKYTRTIVIVEEIPAEEVEEATKEFPLLMEATAVAEAQKLLQDGIADDFPGATVSVNVVVAP
jgi:hypothetical protein